MSISVRLLDNFVTNHIQKSKGHNFRIHLWDQKIILYAFLYVLCPIVVQTFQTTFARSKGRLLIRLPVAAKTALHNAALTAGKDISPSPSGFSLLSTK